VQFSETALVTDAAGLGAAIASRLAGDGASVAIADLDADAAEARAAGLRAGIVRLTIAGR
jgi:NAD(P)-dependent dehydrogenase (short-subunit alcohol dehydrogenase family)